MGFFVVFLSLTSLKVLGPLNLRMFAITLRGRLHECFIPGNMKSFLNVIV